MHLAPCTVKAAMKWVREWHRHLPRIQGGMFAVRVIDDTRACLGVGIAGRRVAA